MSTDWSVESDFVPYQAVETLGACHLLVLAPHPDDEVLGCGGLIARSLASGCAVTVVVVSDGAGAGDPARREQESRAAAQVLSRDGSPPALQFWRLRDRALGADPQLVARLRHLLSTVGADTVLLPSPFEVHPDHRALCLATLHALRAVPDSVEVWCYEVGQPLLPDALIDISPVLDLKCNAIACFGSQLALQSYDEQLLALNRYRAYTLGATVSHAEAFQHLPVEQWRGGMDAVIAGVAARLRRRFGTA
jgi:LmbE family N-acetylglucosaminyl deacetylase